VVVMLRLCQAIARKLSHFDFAVFAENLPCQVDSALRHRAEALDRPTAWEIEDGKGLDDGQRLQVCNRQPHFGRCQRLIGLHQRGKPLPFRGEQTGELVFGPIHVHRWLLASAQDLQLPPSPNPFLLIRIKGFLPQRTTIVGKTVLRFIHDCLFGL
jgi:hypothetical protein